MGIGRNAALSCIGKFVLLDYPIQDAHDPLRAVRHVVIMGDHNNGHPLLIQVMQQFQDARAGARVQVSSGLVRQKDRGLIDERPGDADTLLLATGKLGGEVVGPVCQPNAIKRRAGAFVPVAAIARVQERQFHIGDCGGAWKQVVGLEHEPELTVAYRSEFIVIQARDILAVEQVGEGPMMLTYSPSSTTRLMPRRTGTRTSPVR